MTCITVGVLLLPVYDCEGDRNSLYLYLNIFVLRNKMKFYTPNNFVSSIVTFIHKNITIVKVDFTPYH